jgi:hypothetical protein
MMRRQGLGTFSLVAAVMVTAAATGCRSASPYDISEREAGGVMLVVQNQNYADVDVYAISSGLATRVGTVTGNTSSRFALRSSLISTDFRIVATPIGGNGRASSGPLQVNGGQTVTFIIGPVLAQSTASVQ